MQTPNSSNLDEIEFFLEYLQAVDPLIVDRIENSLKAHLIELILQESGQLSPTDATGLFKAIQAYRGVAS